MHSASIGDYGFDYQHVYDPRLTADFMSYQASSKKWVSLFHYEKLADIFIPGWRYEYRSANTSFDQI